MRLSVPSKRVEPLQPMMRSSGPMTEFAFSTLKAGRTSATSANHQCYRSAFNLSVPSKRVEPLQQLLEATQWSLRRYFQYPQSGSNLCNTTMVITGNPLGRQTLSTHKADRTSATLF